MFWIGNPEKDPQHLQINTKHQKITHNHSDKSLPPHWPACYILSNYVLEKEEDKSQIMEAVRVMGDIESLTCRKAADPRKSLFQFSLQTIFQHPPRDHSHASQGAWVASHYCLLLSSNHWYFHPIHHRVRRCRSLGS